MAQARVSSESATERKRVKEIVKLLRREYPEATCSLVHRDPFQLLVATILSAQCTDERVNQVTPKLFKKYPGPTQMAKAELSDLEELVKSTGFFRSKAKAIRAMSQSLIELHGGEVPSTLESLTQLRGVGRKTANVVLGVAFGVPGMVVDTHVKRISYRLGLTQSTDPKKIEQDLMKVVPKEDWIDFAHLMIFHGRKICTARKAHVEICPIAHLCPKIGVAGQKRR